MRRVIAATGAQGVGKSTLVLALKEQLEKPNDGGIACHLHTGIGQIVADSGLPLGQHATVNTILEFARLHVRREIEISEGTHILDRCLVDLTAYCRLVCPEMRYLQSLIEQLARASCERIDLVVYVPMVDELSSRDSMNETSEFRISVDKEVKSVLEQIDARFVTVSGSTEERVMQVRKILQ